MSLLKRITTTLHTRFERVVNQLENHDAVVEGALRDGRQAVARAKVRLARVRRDGERLAGAAAAARHAEEEWTARARASAADQEQALECLRRRRAQARRAEELERALADHRERETRLAADVAAAERRLAAFTDQRNLMRGRESAAEALGALGAAERDAAPDFEEAMERWEERLTEAELAAEPVGRAAAEHDPLERRFIDREERASLRAELDALTHTATEE